MSTKGFGQHAYHLLFRSNLVRTSSHSDDSVGSYFLELVVILICTPRTRSMLSIINHLIATLKPQSNGPSYSNTVIGTLAVDGWAVTFGTARRGLGGTQAPPRCTKCNSPPINGHSASVRTSYYSMWHSLWSLKG